jgi:membrane protease YdiL (CAAX protease family)
MNSKIGWDLARMLLWLVVVGFLFALSQVVPMGAYALLGGESHFSLNVVRGLMDKLSTNAELMAITGMGSAIFLIPILIALLKFRGSNVKAYFPLKVLTPKYFMLWVALATGWMFGQDYLMEMFHIVKIPDAMLNITYPTELSKWLLVLGVGVMAPILEEVIFRGFLFKEFSYTFLGTWGAVVLTSLIWAVIHSQYDLVYLGIIFITGLLLGVARLYSHTLLVPIVMHILFNVSAAIELYQLKGFL